MTQTRTRRIALAFLILLTWLAVSYIAGAELPDVQAMASRGF